MRQRRHELVHEYRQARDAQDRRFEQSTGGVAASDTQRQEYRDYFGTAGCCGRPVEERLTFKRWLIRCRTERSQP